MLPAIDHAFLSDPDGADLTVLTEAVEFCREIARTPSWRAACGDEIAPGSAPVEAWIRANVAGTYHPSGTCGIGRVVDGSGGVVGLSGLVVADASVFPAIPAANIHLTVVAVAEKLAEGL